MKRLNPMLWSVGLGGMLACLLTACGDRTGPSQSKTKDDAMSLQLTSPAFSEGQPIPAKYTGQGEDVSPPLKWTNVPPGTKSLALISDDPDAPVGTWVHWVIYGLPPNLTELQEKVPPTETLPNGARQGLTDFGRVGYGGPMPPPGKPHRYFFKLYALDSDLTLRAQASKDDLLRAMKGHILAEAQLMGTYQRK